MGEVALATCLTSALYMTGLIWFVQVVHYPLFDQVGRDSFKNYHAIHCVRTGWVVLVPMVLELVSSSYLALVPVAGVSRWLLGLGWVLCVETWLVTFLFSVPEHNRLSQGFESPAHARLVSTNVLRTIGWTAHSALMLIVVFGWRR